MAQWQEIKATLKERTPREYRFIKPPIQPMHQEQKASAPLSHRISPSDRTNTKERAKEESLRFSIIQEKPSYSPHPYSPQEKPQGISIPKMANPMTAPNLNPPVMPSEIPKDHLITTINQLLYAKTQISPTAPRQEIQRSKEFSLEPKSITSHKIAHQTKADAPSAVSLSASNDPHLALDPIKTLLDRIFQEITCLRSQLPHQIDRYYW